MRILPRWLSVCLSENHGEDRREERPTGRDEKQ
jgi:hypothetical protein